MRPWPRLTSVEGSVLVHLERLLGATAGTLSPLPLRLAEPLRPAVAELGRRRMAAATLRFLVEGGGWRRRTVLRPARARVGEDVRLTGRLWDRALNDGFTLRFSANARAFWLASARHLPSLTVAALEASGAAETGVRQRRRAVRDMVPLELDARAPAATGDWALFALVQERLGRLGLTDEGRAALGRRLRLASPLALLMALESDEVGDEALEERLRPLLAAGVVRVVECVEDRLVAAWVARVGEALRLLRLEVDRVGSDTLPRLLARWNGLGRVLRAWRRALDALRRFDLARPLVRLAAALVTQLFVDGGEALRGLVSGMGCLRSMGERDQVIEAIATVVDLGPSLLRRRDELARERYGDDRYHEAQLFVRDVDGELTPLRARLDGLAHGLSGIIT